MLTTVLFFMVSNTNGGLNRCGLKQNEVHHVQTEQLGSHVHTPYLKQIIIGKKNPHICQAYWLYIPQPAFHPLANVYQSDLFMAFSNCKFREKLPLTWEGRDQSPVILVLLFIPSLFQQKPLHALFHLSLLVCISVWRILFAVPCMINSFH